MGDYGTITVEPLTAAIGARVDGVDLTQPVSERAGLRDPRALLLTGRVLPHQDLSEEQQLTSRPTSVRRLREHRRARATKDSSSCWRTPREPAEGDRWHTDVPFVEQPPNIAVLCMRSTPPVGGDTLWASLYGVWDGLSPVMQEAISGLELDVGLGTTAATIRELYGEEYYRRVIDQFEGVRHPLVRIHPETERPRCTSGSFMRDIVGMTKARATRSSASSSRLDDPNVQCRWRWKQHDVVMWDERCTNHRAVSDHYPNYRMIRRVRRNGKPIPVSAA